MRAVKIGRGIFLLPDIPGRRAYHKSRTAFCLHSGAGQQYAARPGFYAVGRLTMRSYELIKGYYWKIKQNHSFGYAMAE
jgi:hypothetical protein